MGKKKGKNRAEPDQEDQEDQEEQEQQQQPGSAPAEPIDISDDAPAAKDESGATMREGIAVAGTSETRHIPSIPYCPICTVPFEYCEWGPQFKKCKEAFQSGWKEHFPEVEGDEALVELMTRLGFEGAADANAKKAQSSKKAAADSAAGGEAGGGGGGSKPKKEKAPPCVVIELNSRNKKKHITTVKGLEHFDGIDVPAAAKLFGKKFACGSAFKKGQNGLPDQIEIQGSCMLELPSLIVDKLKLPIEQIYVVHDGKKIKASDAPTG